MRAAAADVAGGAGAPVMAGGVARDVDRAVWGCSATADEAPKVMADARHGAADVRGLRRADLDPFRLAVRCVGTGGGAGSALVCGRGPPPPVAAEADPEHP